MEATVKLDIGDKVRISDITMTCTVVKRDFQGEFYTMVYFAGGDLKCLDFSGGELKALGARMMKEGGDDGKDC